MLQYIIAKKLTVVFPNVCITFWIYLSILATSCEGKRSFSTIKRVINYSKSTIGQEKLTNPALLYFKHGLIETSHHQLLFEN